MSYVAWSVVFGEQPTAAKWNILGDNDASFNDGTGIDDNSIINRHIAAAQIDLDQLDVTDIQANQQAWQNATLLNSWVNYQDPEVNFPKASYFKDSLGIVHTRGLIKSGTTTSSTDLFIYPAGYRPEYDQHFAVTSNGTFCVLRIEQDGGLEISSGASSSWIDLCQIRFRAA